MRGRPWIALVAAGLLAAALFAQEAAVVERENEDWQPSTPTEGFWPTRLMMERAIDRITEEVATQYEFDEEQLQRTRALWKERFPAFLNENRAQIQTLMNEFFEAQLSGEAPTPEVVATWSQRVLPLFNQFADLARSTSEEMRTYLTEEQAAILDGNIAAFNVGAGMVNNKLGAWADGHYDPENEWVFDRGERRRIEEERRKQMEAEMARAREAEMAAGQAHEQATDAAATALDGQAGSLPPGDPADHRAADRPTGDRPENGAAGTGRASAGGRETRPAAPAREKDEWERYVEDFCKRYEFSESQRSSAERFLREAQKARDEFKLRRAKQFDTAQEKLKAAQSDDDKKTAAEELAKLARPIERMFQQLKDRLNKLPTAAQRAKAAQDAPASQPAGAPPEKPKLTENPRRGG